MSVDNQDSKSSGYTHKVSNQPNIMRKEFGSTHSDMMLVSLDWEKNTVILTFLNSHILPDLKKEGWFIDNISYEVVAEIKLPRAVFDTSLVYYIWMVSGGLNIMPTLEDYLKKHPFPPEKQKGISFGPTAVRFEPNQPEGQQNPK